MKQIYQNPIIEVEKYTLDEILTDLISASAPASNNTSNATWEAFVSGIF